MEFTEYIKGFAKNEEADDLNFSVWHTVRSNGSGL
jgi:hypothetical protein